MTKPLYSADLLDGTYQNPLLWGDYSDPDVIRVGEDYWMVASSFNFTPGLPLLHSRDLVNWKVVRYLIDEIPFPEYDRPQHGKAVWAPSIRYHQGKFYVYVPFPDEGLFVTTACDPMGVWSPLQCIKKAAGWIDPCPFWDEDGTAWMVNGFARSRIGFKSMLLVSRMSPDGMEILDLEDRRFVFDGHPNHPTVEGPKFYKRNGWYYIFAPAGGVATGWQLILRARHPLGPYEEKVVLAQGSTPVNGPHQGAWIDTPSGQDWFIHFQDTGYCGRVPHLQPMRWEDDWPVMGERNAETGTGQPVMHWKKPDHAIDMPVSGPETSDDFAAPELGLQWQWSGNGKKAYYQLTDRGLELFTSGNQNGESALLWHAPNMLSQMFQAPAFRVETELTLCDTEPGDAAGIAVLGRHYAALRKVKGEVQLLKGHEDQGETLCESIPHDAGTLTVALDVEEGGKCTFSMRGAEGWHQFTTDHQAEPGVWVGSRFGVFAMNTLQKRSEGKGTFRSVRFSVKRED